MKTKLFLTLGVAMAMTTFSYAQSKTTFGIRAGGNLFTVNGEDLNGDDLDLKLKPGFNVGINAEIPVGIDFYLQPGVIFSQKGYKFDGDDDDKVNISYVEVPVNFIYKPELGTGKMLLGFGPYFGVAVGASYKPDGSGEDVDYKFKSDLTAAEAVGTTPYLKRFDAGGNLLVGYEFANKLSFQLNAQLGMLKINPTVEGDEYGKMKNTGFGLSLGYRF